MALNLLRPCSQRLWQAPALAFSRRGMASKFNSFFDEEATPKVEHKAPKTVTPVSPISEASNLTSRLPRGVLPSSQDVSLPEAPQTYETNEDVAKHPEVYALMHPQGRTAAEQYLSPLKAALYAKAVAIGGGKYVNDLELEHEGEIYRLHLSETEQKALEPSVYAKSWRIKWSWKKMYMFLRPYRKMNVENAIAQMQFAHKIRAKEVAEMLEAGLEQGKQLGLDPRRLVIDQIWVGKDGHDKKRIDIKGRGRSGMIVHPYVHVKAILKDVSSLEQLEERRLERAIRSKSQPARNYRLLEDKSQRMHYRW